MMFRRTEIVTTSGKSDPQGVTSLEMFGPQLKALQFFEVPVTVYQHIWPKSLADEVLLTLKFPYQDN
jgi:hypothetical protein